MKFVSVSPSAHRTTSSRASSKACRRRAVRREARNKCHAAMVRAVCRWAAEGGCTDVVISKSLLLTKFSHNLGRIAMLSIDSLIHRRISSAVILPASASSAILICGQRRKASSRTSGTAW